MVWIHERGAFEYLELVFANEDGTSNRARHEESGRFSKYFYNINFTDSLISYHNYLFDKDR
ncbi:TPA: hypothetical protein SMM93_000486 [Proteus mirabilis]|uniref:hypothetical protein n=1 Tax=Proteus genomosp. 6 TaxID=1311820 RepID=UPI0029E15880